MKTVCSSDMCAGCMACTGVCRRNAITITDDSEHFNAVIDETKCADCGRCYAVCQQNDPPQLKQARYWYQGWAKSEEVRKTSSSGGAASEIIRAFIENGGSVCSCAFDGNGFSFAVADNVEQAKAFAGSKYVKSDPRDAYERVEKILKDGGKVLFLGLPCQSAGIQKYIKDEYKQGLYTADLICHGTPSEKLLSKYLNESGISYKSVGNIQFRKETDIYGLITDGKRLVPKRVKDAYTMCFLEGVDYTEYCYSCRYASADRVSDITLGDSWSCNSEELEKGVSLILVQTEKGKELLDNADMILETADPDEAIAANRQLRCPSEKAEGREAFFAAINSGKSFRHAAFRALPLMSAKQSVKYFLLKTLRR